jgi:hypothetical protein
MSDPLRDVFEILEPPPGGLSELRCQVTAERTPRGAWLGGLAVAAVAALLVVVALPRAPEPGAELAARVSCADPVLASLLCGRVDPGVAVQPAHQARMALQEVPTGSERVLLYRVASSSHPLEAGQVPKVDVVAAAQ